MTRSDLVRVVVGMAHHKVHGQRVDNVVVILELTLRRVTR